MNFKAFENGFQQEKKGKGRKKVKREGKGKEKGKRKG